MATLLEILEENRKRRDAMANGRETQAPASLLDRIKQRRQDRDYTAFTEMVDSADPARTGPAFQEPEPEPAKSTMADRIKARRQPPAAAPPAPPVAPEPTTPPPGPRTMVPPDAFSAPVQPQDIAAQRVEPAAPLPPKRFGGPQEITDAPTAPRNIGPSQAIEPVTLPGGNMQIQAPRVDTPAARGLAVPSDPATINTGQAMQLATDIAEGRVDVATLTPDQVPWRQLLGRPGLTDLAAMGATDPQRAFSELQQRMTKVKGSAGFQVGKGLEEGTTAALSLFPMDKLPPPETNAEAIGQFVGQVVGQLPAVYAATLTGGAALTNLVGKLYPALNGTAKAAQIAKAAVGALGTGATIGTAREAARQGYLPEEAFDPVASAKRIGQDTAEYGTYGTVYPVAKPAVQAAGRAAGKLLPAGAQKAVQALGAAAPAIGDVVEGSISGAVAGTAVGAGKAAVQEALSGDPDLKRFVRNTLSETGQEASEELVEGIAFGIVQGLIGRNKGAVIRAAGQQTKADSPAPSAAPVQQAPAPPVAAQPSVQPQPTPAAATAAQAPAPAMDRAALLRNLNPNLSETSVQDFVRTTQAAPAAAFEALARRQFGGAPAQQSAASQQAPETPAGATVPPATPDTAKRVDSTRVLSVAGKAEPAATVKPIATGNTAQAKTERGTAVQTQYVLVEAADLIASHDPALRVDQRYPAELQPRDRGRAASEDQINNIVANLEPEFLGESPKASEGAPIVGPDGVVESGNGRVIALKRAYEQKQPSGSKYRQWLADNAEKFGLNANAIWPAKAPVLVRVRQTEVDRAAFAKEANEQAVAAMSATEQAKSDAQKLSGALMQTFIPDDNGNVATAANRDFIRGYMEQVVGPAERGRYMTGDGSISQEGITRIRNAVFAKAYGDTAAIEKLAESTDNNVKNITSAMLAAAPRLAAVKDGIARGVLHDLDLSADIAKAMGKLSQLRELGDKVEVYLQQQTLLDDGMTNQARNVLDVFNKAGSAKAVREILMAYADVVEAVGNPNQRDMFARAVTKAEVWQAAVERVAKNSGADLQATLWQNQGMGGQGIAAATGRAGQTQSQTATGEGPAAQQTGQVDDASRSRESERGGIRLPGANQPPPDPLAQELDKAISWNNKATERTVRNLPQSLKQTANRLVDEWFDKNSSIRRMQKALAPGKKELPVQMDAYLRLELLPKIVPGRVEAKLRQWQEAMKPVSADLQNYLRYADARSAVYRAQKFEYEDNKLPFPRALAEAYIAKHESPAFKKAFDAEQKLFGEALRELVKAGVLDTDALAAIEGAYTDENGNINYVPMYRDRTAGATEAKKAKEQQVGVAGAGRSAVNVPQGVLRQRGGSDPLLDPIERRIRYFARVIGVAERNQAGQALATLADELDTEGVFMQKTRPPMEHVEVQAERIMDELEEIGADTSEVDPTATVEFFRPKWARGKNDTIITVFRDGKRVYYDVKTADVLKTLTHMDPLTTNMLASIAQGMTTLYRTGATSTPSFTIANLVKDTFEAFALSKRQMFPGHGLFEVLKLAVKKDPFVQRTIDAGLKQGGWLRPEKQSKVMLQDIAKGKRITLSPRGLWRIYQEFREQPEFWNRLGEASLEYKARRKEGMPDEDAFLKALFEGGRITLNFTRAGYTARQVNRYVPFFKIPFEAAYRIQEAATEHPRIFFLKALLPALAVASLTVWLNRDDERYIEASNYERDRYVLIPAGKALLRIPKGHGVVTIWHNIVERALSQRLLEDPDAFDKEFGYRLFEEFMPRVTNPALELLVAAMTGYSVEDKREIVPFWEQNMTADKQYDERTSLTARKVGDVTGLSPRVVDYSIRRFAPGYSEGFLNMERWYRQWKAEKEGSAALPARGPEETVGLGRFVSRPGEGKQGRSVSRFYETLDRADKIYNSLRRELQNESAEDVNMARLTEAQKRILPRLLLNLDLEDRRYLARRKKLMDYDKMMDKVRDERARTEKRTDLDAAAKRRRLDTINRALTNIAREAMKPFDEQNEKGAG